MTGFFKLLNCHVTALLFNDILKKKSGFYFIG